MKISKKSPGCIKEDCSVNIHKLSDIINISTDCVYNTLHEHLYTKAVSVIGTTFTNSQPKKHLNEHFSKVLGYVSIKLI